MHGGGKTDGMAEQPSTTSAGEAQVVGVDSDAADELLSALGSDTARAVLSSVHDDPATPSELADRLDMSLQRVHHHVQNLDDADLVTGVDTKRSSNGNEMTVYGPADGPVLVFAGEEDDSSDLRSMLGSLLSGFGILAVASLLVQEAVGDGIDALFGGGETGTGGGGGGMSTASTESANQAAATGPPPGVVFFLGGAVVLLAAAAVWYWQQR